MQPNLVVDNGEIDANYFQHLPYLEAVSYTHLAGLNKRLWQYFALLGALPGEDTRVIIALRAMQSSDPAQLAHAARLPFDLLERVTDRIRRERPEVAHVLYDLNPSSRSTGAEW